MRDRPSANKGKLAVRLDYRRQATAAGRELQAAWPPHAWGVTLSWARPQQVLRVVPQVISNQPMTGPPQVNMLGAWYAGRGASRVYGGTRSPHRKWTLAHCEGLPDRKRGVQNGVQNP